MAPSPVKILSKIRVDGKHHGFVDAAGKPFMPFGVTYLYRPGTGWDQVSRKRFDAETTRRDFARLKGKVPMSCGSSSHSVPSLPSPASSIPRGCPSSINSLTWPTRRGYTYALRVPMPGKVCPHGPRT